MRVALAVLNQRIIRAEVKTESIDLEERPNRILSFRYREKSTRNEANYFKRHLICRFFALLWSDFVFFDRQIHVRFDRRKGVFSWLKIKF